LVLLFDGSTIKKVDGARAWSMLAEIHLPEALS
jgi:hypothetical protein